MVITGTGRAGTTFLVDLLCHLGLDTGYSVETLDFYKYPNARAGLELDIRKPDCPYIVKSPWFTDYADEVLRRDDIIVDHIFIPIRDLYAAAESRRTVSQSGLTGLSIRGYLRRFLDPRHWFHPKEFPGGLSGTSSSMPGAQENVLLKRLYQLLFAVSGSTVPITLLRFPRITEDSEYLYGKLRPLLGDMAYSHFHQVFCRVVRPDLVHRFGDGDR